MVARRALRTVAVLVAVLVAMMMVVVVVLLLNLAQVGGSGESCVAKALLSGHRHGRSGGLSCHDEACPRCAVRKPQPPRSSDRLHATLAVPVQNVERRTAACPAATS